MCENVTSNLKSSQAESSFMSMFNDIDRTRERKRWNFYFKFRRSQGIREEILAGTLNVSRSWRRKEAVWNSSLHTWRKMGFHSHSNGGNDSKIQNQFSWGIGALSRGILVKKKGRDTIHLNADASNTELLFRIISFCKSGQYLRSSFELVWTSRPDRGKRTRETERIRDQRSSDKCKITTFGIFSTTSIWKLFAGKHSGLRLTVRGHIELASFRHRVAAGMSYKTWPVEDDGFGQIIFPMPNSDPVQNYSLNFRKQKEENLAWHSRRTRIQETGATHVSSETSIKETCADTPFLRPKRSGKLSLPILRLEGLCQ